MSVGIDELTKEELIELNHEIVERLRLPRQMRDHTAMLRFSIGQRVSFADADGQSVSGVLTRYNKKTVTVISEDGHRWNVAGIAARIGRKGRHAGVHHSHSNETAIVDCHSSPPPRN